MLRNDVRARLFGFRRSTCVVSIYPVESSKVVLRPLVSDCEVAAAQKSDAQQPVNYLPIGEVGNR